MTGLEQGARDRSAKPWHKAGATVTCERPGRWKVTVAVHERERGAPRKVTVVAPTPWAGLELACELLKKEAGHGGS